MRSGLTVLSTAALGGGLALALAGPAHAAVPASSCGEGTTFAITSGPSVDTAVVSSVTDALVERGFGAASASAADLSVTVAPASEIAESGSASVMGVAISAGGLDPTAAAEGTDWVAVTGAAGDAAELLLEDACGPLPTHEADEIDPAQDGDDSVTEAPAAPAQPQTQGPTETTSAGAQGQAAPAVPGSVAPAAKEAAPATESTGDGEAAASASQQSAAPAPAAPAPAAAATSDSASTSGAAVSVADKDCGDFGSQEEAQTFFEDNGGPSSDVHRLDADDDGQACEGSFGGESAGAAASSTDKDCGDFGSQAEAQAFFTGHGGPATDTHRLDRDNDGQACEDDFGGDNASRAEARTIHAGAPAASEASAVGLVGGGLLAVAGIALGLRARRS